MLVMRTLCAALLLVAGFAAGVAAQTTSSSDPDRDLARECLVTNVFYDSDVREILNALGAQCYVNIVADETVSGILTIELEDIPLEEAMTRCLSPFGLTYRWMGSYYLVGQPRPENPSFPLLTETELYRPSHVKATDIPLLMSSYYEPYIRVSRETNTVTLTGSPELLARMKADLANIDTPPRQVMIEALVTETTSDIARQLGIALSAGGSNTVGDSLRFDIYPQVGGDSAYSARENRIGALFQSIGIESGSWVGQFRARLDALVEEGEAEIRANPSIATLEGNKARIFIGREEYFSILTGSVSFAYAQLEVIKTGIILTITPYVSDDGEITLEVEPEVSDVIGSGSTGLPVTSKRSVTTKVRVVEGETVVIGGLKVLTRHDIVRKVPLLGDIPIIGRLFRHNDTRNVETEVTVLITPRIWQPERVDRSSIAP